MMLYAQGHQGEFPPAYVADAKGTPIHSWRAILLPYLVPKHKAYFHDEPWDGVNNQVLGMISPEIYCDPRLSTTAPTNIVLVVGPGTLWPDGRNPKSPRTILRPEETIIGLEIKSNGVPWTSPTDLTALEILKTVKAEGLAAFSPYSDGCVIALFADGHVELIGPHIEVDELRRRLLPESRE
jgi:prepilin-type processing-associated H-X9-DG protein